MKHVLEIDSVQLQLNNRKILSGIYLKCETGQITGLLGKNGEGKSSLMKIMYGSLPCEKSVRFDHMSVLKTFKRPDLLVYLPQFNFIPGSLSLRRVFHDFELAYSTFEDRFPEFTGREKLTVGSLSGGERRLVEVYLIVKAPSQFAMLDEPFTQLNPLQIEKVKELLTQEKANKGFLITDHMYRHILDLSDRLFLVKDGKTIFIRDMQHLVLHGYVRVREQL